MNNRTKNIRAKLKMQSADNKSPCHELKDLLQDKDLFNEEQITYVTFESTFYLLFKTKRITSIIISTI